MLGEFAHFFILKKKKIKKNNYRPSKMQFAIFKVPIDLGDLSMGRVHKLFIE